MNQSAICRLVPSVIPALLSTPILADEIVQEPDFHTALISGRDILVPLSTAADDFVVPGDGVLDHIEATFLVHPMYPIVGWEYLLYADGGGHPGQELLAAGGGEAEDTGETAFELNVVTVTFSDLNLSLEPGDYLWFAVRGIGQGGGTAAWVTANAEHPNWSEAYLRSEYFGWDDWTSSVYVAGDFYDTAWTLTFVPGPGAGAVLVVVGGIVGGGRRRRRGAVGTGRSS